MRRVLILAVTGVLLTTVAMITGASPKAQRLIVTMNEYQFTPKTITVQAGAPVELTLVNKGKIEHEFSVYTPPKSAPEDWDEFEIANTYFTGMGEVGVAFRGQGAVAGTHLFEVKLERGKSATIEFTPTNKGTFEMACHIKGHYEAGMKGVLVVK